MKTIEVKLYSFDELSEEAKEKVINEFRDNEYNTTPWFIDEANETFEKFADLFSIDWRNIDYCEPYRNKYKIKLDDNVLALTGQRLATYIWNNYKRDLFKGKFYGCIENDKKYFHPCIKSKELKGRARLKNWFNPYYSRIILDNSCVLTGVCYDESVLKPIYEFLNNPKDNIDFETLLNDCIYSLCHSVESEIEYRLSDEAIIETIQDNEYEFTEDGELA